MLLAVLVTIPGKAGILPASGSDLQEPAGRDMAPPCPFRSNNSDVLVQEGTTALRANHLNEAIEKFQAACQISPNLANAQHQWGIALVKAGRPTEAVDHFKTAIALNPQQAASWLSLAGAYQAQGSMSDAINAYSDFVSRFPQDRDLAKVRQLIVMLKREANNQSACLAPIVSPSALGTSATPSSDLLKKPKDQSVRISAGLATNGGVDDYLGEMTTAGVLRWPAAQMPLRIWIEDGMTVPGYQPAFAGILKQAFIDWANGSNGLIKLVFVTDIMKANIICRWSAQPDKFKNSVEAGESRLYSDRYGVAKGELFILTVPTCLTLPLTDNRLRAIALHEIGHLLGLAGHTSDPRDIMFYSASKSDTYRNLSPRDRATICHLYRDR